MRSPVFEAELYGPMRDKTRNITVKDMQPDVFKALLHLIYTDSLPVMDDPAGEPNTEMVKHLLVAADRYALERMKLMCESILCNRIDVKNVASTLALADQYYCSNLKDACIGFINSSERVDDVMASKGYKHLKRVCPEVLIGMDGPKSNKPSNYTDDPEKLLCKKRIAEKRSKSLGDLAGEPVSATPRVLFRITDPEAGAMADQPLVNSFKHQLNKVVKTDFQEAQDHAPYQLERYVGLVAQQPFIGSEDPNQHLQCFLEVCSTFKVAGLTGDQARVRLFPFSLVERPKKWYNSLENAVKTTWETLAVAFLAKYFPPVGETVERFYIGLNIPSHQHLDASAAGSFMSKTPTQAKELIKLLVENQSWDSERSSRNLQPSKGVAKSVIEKTHEDLVMDRLDAIQRRLDNNSHIPKEESLRLAESRSTCDECGEFGHV
ncbi:hypothetical protein PR202_gb25617 [Eleusine coracana subsp. coracana]|uniref:BTB domain-containing protein n=1 Tax=Eleusine coracana subsp. coracana TaxID=191504 RepID=A0AAV5FPM3_ELECO|nr:hypothetical protein PR202_gb25617 [Eleusine coracana subsp. coracana]